MPGTMIDKLIGYGLSPTKILFTQNKHRHDHTDVDFTSDFSKSIIK